MDFYFRNEISNNIYMIFSLTYQSKNYPWMCSLLRHLGRYVCMWLYHCTDFWKVIAPTFLVATRKSSCFLYSPSGRPCLLASSLLFIIRCWAGRDKWALIAALKQLMASSTMLRKGLYGGCGSYFRQESC